MFKNKITIALFCVAAACGMFCFWLTVHSSAQYMKAGASPTGEGWASLAVSLLGSLGFSVAGVINAILHRFSPSAPPVTEQTVAEVVEMTEAFEALLKDRSNRAALRRFVFALVDESKHLSGVEASTENGVVVIRYSGYADPVTPVVGTSK